MKWSSQRASELLEKVGSILHFDDFHALQFDYTVILYGQIEKGD